MGDSREERLKQSTLNGFVPKIKPNDHTLNKILTTRNRSKLHNNKKQTEVYALEYSDKGHLPFCLWTIEIHLKIFQLNICHHLNTWTKSRLHYKPLLFVFHELYKKILNPFLVPITVTQISYYKNLGIAIKGRSLVWAWHLTNVKFQRYPRISLLIIRIK